MDAYISNHKLKIVSIIEDAITLLSRHFMVLFALTMVTQIGAIINYLSQLFLAYPEDSTASILTVTLPIIAIIITLYASVFLIYKINSIYSGEEKSLREISLQLGVVKLIKYVLTSFFYMVIVGIGLLLLIVPGIYLAVRYCLAPVHLLLEDDGIIASFKKSAVLVKGYSWNILGLFALYLLLFIAFMIFAVLFGMFLPPSAATAIIWLIALIPSTVSYIVYVILYRRLLTIQKT